MTNIILFLLGVYMDKTILGILIGSLTTLVGVGLTSFFNYKTKMRELKHNEHLKELELKDREKERKFKIEEKMIEKSIQAHVEAYGKIMAIFELVNRYYTAETGLLISPTKKKRMSYRNIYTS